MVIVKLNGGLGNQLFQYAAGLSLALKNNDVLKIDISGYKLNSKRRQIFRNLDILDFLISAPTATPYEISGIKYPFGFLSKVTRVIKQRFFKVYYIDWHPEILKKSGNIYLDGYFQTEKYFLDRVDSIFTELTLNPELSARIDHNIHQIAQESVSVSIHIRRGDYANDPKTRKYHLVCDANYYQRAIKEIENLYPNFHLFIFSDDLGWVRKNISLPSAITFVSKEAGARDALRPSQELLLMSKCHHHILSNSSFSWWGAYLNRSPYKTVLAPTLWNRGMSQPNILPVGWTPFAVQDDWT